MNVSAIIGFVSDYGIIILAVLAYVEYLNIPGFPGGFVMPAAGVTSMLGYTPFFLTLAVLILSATLSELTVYGVSHLFSTKIEAICKKREKTAKIYEKTVGIINKHGALGLFTARLIPVVRTFISIPAGLMKMRLREYIPVSLAGNTVYSLVMMLLGYFFTSFFV